METEFIIDIDTPKKAFESSLKLPGNTRLIFSAPFGSGKTFFLKRFFNESDKYLALHLYPINYSVSKNEDIFELVKYDLLYELLKHKVALDKLDVSFTSAIPFLDSEEQIKAIGRFLSFIPKIGKTVVDVLDELKKLTKSIEDKRESLKIDEGERIKQFSNVIQQTKGSIYEIDFYSNLIIDLVKRLKTENKKEIVLIIDDLDRIDPDHIFRLLNIFASHLDMEKNEENKFDLDKIILSCDIENIRTIFHNKFGQDVDFSGYIDKFYSREVFEFNNKVLISRAIHNILTSIRIDQKYDGINFISTPNKEAFPLLKYLLISFVNSNVINLRILLKLYNKEYHIRSYSLVIGSKKVMNWQAPITLIFDFLVYLFGDTKALKRAIDKAAFSVKGSENQGIRDRHIVILCGELILLADIRNNRLITSNVVHKTTLDNQTYNYKIEIYDVLTERYSACLLNDAGERLYLDDTLEVKTIIQNAYESYLQIEKELV